MKSGTARSLTAGAPVTLLLVLAACTGLQKLYSTDYWWHLRTGYWIAEMGGVPLVDVFTYTAAGARYIDAHWLFQLGLAGVHALVGHEGVVIAKTLLAAGLVAILIPVGWRRERAWVTALGLGVMLLIACGRFLPRPEMLSFVLLAAILALLERNERRGDAWSYAIVALQLVWVNVHGLFALGIALCAIYLVSEVLRSLRSREVGALRRLATINLLVVLVSLANPNFVEGALYPIRQLGMIGPSGDHGIATGYILELLPVWHPEVPRVMLVLPALLGLACGVALLANWRHDRSRWAHALAFLAFLGLGLQANRNLALFAIVAAPLLILGANQWMDRHPPSPSLLRAANTVTALLLLAASVDVARGRFHARVGAIHEPGLGYVDLYVPEGAADWIERERPPGPIAHNMWDGGYLAWRLYPDYPVMVDGRLEIYGPQKLAALRFMMPRDLQRLNARYEFGVILLNPTFHPPELIAWLRQQPRWRMVYADVSGVLFVRTDADGSPQWPAIDVNAPGFLPANEAPLSSLDLIREKTRIRLLAALGLEARAVAEAQAILER